MNCGCTKDLGCFAPCQIIDFGFINPCAGGGGGGTHQFTFQIWTNGGYTEIVKNIHHNDPVTLPFNFNENGVTMIKIKLPSCMVGPGVHYATTPDGACCFSVTGLPPICGTLPECNGDNNGD